MQNFQQILTEAAQLKEHQLKKDRKEYESLPQFLKSGLGFNKKYEVIRKQSVHYQYRISHKVKEQGNVLFKEGKIEEALNKYEEALGIFRYIESKTYENLKDQDLSYHMYDLTKLPTQMKEKLETHLCALYLNISSCLTKQNKKEDAIYSADEALKLRKTAKGHYKKAQAYLKFVNRDANDIKLGILELKQAYSIEKDPGLLNQMYAAKENYEKEQEKSKNWFKFMFDKNKKIQQPVKQKEPQKEKPKPQLNPENEFQRKQMVQLQKAATGGLNEKQKFQQTKEKLKLYIPLPEQKWLYSYQKDFIKRNGSKIYSILKIYRHEDLAAQLRPLLANCLELEESSKNEISCKECIDWLKAHPVPQIGKYIERYELQTGWIAKNRTATPQKENENEIEEKMIKEEDLQMFQSHKKDEQQQKIQSKRVKNTKQFNQFRKDLESQQEQRRKAFNLQEIQVKDKKHLTREERKKYITLAIILFLLLVRFLWS